MTSLMEKRVLAGGAAVTNHSLYKEGRVNELWFEEDVIDAITDILHWATRKNSSFRGEFNVDRVFRCAKTHLKAEAAEKIFDKDPEPVCQPIIGQKLKVKWGPKRSSDAQERVARSTAKKRVRYVYCHVCGGVLERNGDCERCSCGTSS